MLTGCYGQHAQACHCLSGTGLCAWRHSCIALKLLACQGPACREANNADNSLRWRSGLCYLPSAALPEAVAREGLTLVAEGQTNFTRHAPPREPMLGMHRTGGCLALGIADCACHCLAQSAPTALVWVLMISHDTSRQPTSSVVHSCKKALANGTGNNTLQACALLAIASALSRRTPVTQLFQLVWHPMKLLQELCD